MIMAVQELTVMIVVLAAAAWLGFRAFKALRRKGCGPACGGCGTIDFSKIEAQIKAAESAKRN